VTGFSSIILNNKNAGKTGPQISKENKMMYSDIKDELVKGFQYRYEPERVQVISENEVYFHGRHTIHRLRKKGDAWVCGCKMYQDISRLPMLPFCRHTIPTERVTNTPSLVKRMVAGEKSTPALAFVTA
jgi:hypothetical protein